MENLRLTSNTDILVGKVIESTQLLGCEGRSPDYSGCDGQNSLFLYFTDGSAIKVVGTYGEYSGASCDEYPELLNIHYKPQ